MLLKTLAPSIIWPDTQAQLTYTIVNAANNPGQSNLGFVDTLPSNTLPTGLSITADSSQCGGTVKTMKYQLEFSGGKLDAGQTSCTIYATVTGSFPIDYSNLTVSQLSGGLVSAVADFPGIIIPASLTDSGVTVYDPTATVTSAPGADPVVYVVTPTATSTASVNNSVSADIIAVDSNGGQVDGTAGQSSDLNNIVNKDTATPVPLAPVTISVPAAAAAKIKLWIVTSVAATARP